MMGLAHISWADQVQLSPVADTSLFEANPDNNLGAYTNLPAGATETGMRARALIRFDLTDAIPAGGTITSVSLTVTVVRTPSTGGAGSPFELRRLFQNWGEGNKGRISTGVPASPGEATWNARFALTNLWSQPGGQASVDFSDTPSATTDVGGPGSYTFSSTSTLVRDVQSWLDDPSSNFGWILMSQSETVRGSARRFASREAPTGMPVLNVDYVAPLPALRLTGITLSGTNATLTWAGGKPPYQIRMRPNFSVPWSLVGGPVTNTKAIVPVSGPQRCYQVFFGNP